jgi:hypothetical protein
MSDRDMLSSNDLNPSQAMLIMLLATAKPQYLRMVSKSSSKSSSLAILSLLFYGPHWLSVDNPFAWFYLVAHLMKAPAYLLLTSLEMISSSQGLKEFEAFGIRRFGLHDS